MKANKIAQTLPLQSPISLCGEELPKLTLIKSVVVASDDGSDNTNPEATVLYIPCDHCHRPIEVQVKVS